MTDTLENTQTATLPEIENISNARNLGGEKETITRQIVVAHDSDGFHRPVEARWYMGRSRDASVVYCSIWINARKRGYWSGYGRAGGGGYDKYSAALESAINSAGIKMSQHFGGGGDSATREALTAIANACGYTSITIV